MEDARFIPRKNPVQSRARSTVEAIISAAIQFLDKQPDSFTTAKLAKLAGVSVGSLYQYFPNKQAIIAKLIEVHADESLEQIRLALEEVHSKDIQDYIKPIIANTVDLCHKRRYTMRFIYKQIFDVEREAIHLKLKNDSANLLIETIRERRLKPAANGIEAKIRLTVEAVVGMLYQCVMYEADTFNKDKMTADLTAISARLLA